ncbi:carbon-nitrogen hydrolase family protein [uncultured Thalassospira sp.]|uniref:carbon-nitrogen hydrolase family protein n=1 Tax=uncultured Thalassospira sp. TaxID=404382 RepID=UPI002583FF88|nr:carbon-nitrogen hydrolase family protein [uncultured Thalassospira sp.]
MLLAAAQTPVSSDIAANGKAIRRVLLEAARQGARLICFGEGALSGYPKNYCEKPDDWGDFDWVQQEAELDDIIQRCQDLQVYAVVGYASFLDANRPPHNSLIVIGPDGKPVRRYDKRVLSHGESQGWYSPGQKAVLFEVDGVRVGCAICLEIQFPEIFSEYERLGTDLIIHASSGLPPFFETALQAQAGFYCQWVMSGVSIDQSLPVSSGIIGPDGGWLARGSSNQKEGFALARLDKSSGDFEIALSKARPWRAKVRAELLNHNDQFKDHKPS